MCDLLDRKRVATGKLDLAAVEARYTMTVTDAAARLGMKRSEVTAAVRDRRLSAWGRGEETRLDPRSVDTF